MKVFFMTACFLGMLSACIKEEAPASRPINKNSGNTEGLLGYEDPSCQAVALAKSGLYLTFEDEAFIAEAEEFVQLSTGLAVKAKLESYRSISSPLMAQTSKSVALHITLGELPLCQSEVLVHQNGDKMLFHGDIPAGLAAAIRQGEEAVANLVWPAPEKAADMMLRALIAHGLLSPDPHVLASQGAELLAANRCLAWQEQMFIPFWQIKLRANNHNYWGISNEKAIFTDKYGDVLEAEAFHASGSVYIRNEGQSSFTYEIKNVALSEIANSKFLCNSKFVTDHAYSLNNNYIFNANDSQYRLEEVTIFHNANTHSDWLRSLDASQGWPGPQIRLFIDATNNTKNNTAVYLPNSESGTPTIKLGNGDQTELKNLLREPEVVSHELGHHLVYRKLTSTRGEALVLHEGLADYFVFARTSNPCLAETICPTSSKVCFSSKCLRTAENSMKYTDTDLPPEGHKQSQLISGLLWDIGQKIGHTKVANLVYQAVNYFRATSGFEDFLIALMTADKDLYQGANACTIQTAAIARGFQSVLGRLNCQQFSN